jgi:tetratricopeptide (TPR) repeat protein
MEKELAQRYLSIGVIKSALEIFERLEMWEDVVKCYGALEKPEQGIAIVKDLLEGRKEEADVVLSRGKSISASTKLSLDATRQAKLWCLLGDLEPANAIEHYEKAWQISNDTSGRAMRSLGGCYFARAEYRKAIDCLKKAVEIHPLLTKSWFILGCAAMRVEEWEEARNAFSRCVAIDEEDGESWNNLASMYLRLGGAKALPQVMYLNQHSESPLTGRSCTGTSKPTTSRRSRKRRSLPKQGSRFPCSEAGPAIQLRKLADVVQLHACVHGRRRTTGIV